jgi:tetratricopeptide (TPR) repeat protein
MRAPLEKRNIIMAITGNVYSTIERYDTSTPSPTQFQISQKIQELKNFVTIAKNILGPTDTTPLCYNLNNITYNDIEIKGTKIINNLLFNALRKAIDNNNYFDVASLIISLYRYEGQFEWLGKITENDSDGNPSKIGIDSHLTYQSGEFASLSRFIKFAEEADRMSILSKFEIGTPDYNKTLNIYNYLVSNTRQEPISIENFGKLYALLGLYLLKLKERRESFIGFKQMQLNCLNPSSTIVYPPCDS